MGNTKATLVFKKVEKAMGSMRTLKNVLALNGRDISSNQEQQSDNDRWQDRLS